ncbi:hypothetical protein Ait01nite_090330 [Actinoplanes italicus]|uniref:Uncharacterized protein n=1 Tax=Actinoplanes italicus TaxID=113567 RepID=A0A2T0JTP7_9ACTN|nr:DUF6584 family protein [Actinoplanes italicus]PRX11029.1 hypothetical protein CLV67_13287 [Actinoplanes italicus]GIE35988.1 hypothetical protein Ait01nite_090330 [Actinoplanes italicus]
MAKPEVLAKVDADLERGHTHLAAQRLNSLIAADPFDLGLRARLAAVHRRTGNFAEAGRWGYLTEDVTEAELRAFAKAYSDQLRALVLHGETPRDLGPLAAARLAALPHPPVFSPRQVPAQRVEAYKPPEDTSAGEVIFGLLLMVCAAIGVISVIRWFL